MTDNPLLMINVVYRLHGRTKMVQLETRSLMPISWWFGYGFCEPSYLDPRYAIPTRDILKLTWHDPVLGRRLTVRNPDWEEDDA